MEVIVEGYIAPKLKEKYSDCADSYANSFDNRNFAISDGVTKSFFPSVWSKLLVEQFVQKKELITNDNIIEKLIKDCQEEWYKRVTEEVKKPNIPWFTKKSYVERKFAMATFIGLQFYEKDSHWKWNAIGLGDSYLIFVPTETQKEPEKWIIVVPMENLIEPTFDNYPNYYASIGNQHKGEPCFVEDKDLVEGTFYLMTDALAEWFFNEKEKAIEKIKKWKSQEDYINFIVKERADNLLKDDDSAIMIINIPKQIDTLIEVDNNISILQELIAQEEKNEKEKAKVKEIQNTESSIKEGDISNTETKENQVEPAEKDDVSSKETKESLTKEEIKKTPVTSSKPEKSTEHKKSPPVKEKAKNQLRNAINKEEITNKF